MKIQVSAGLDEETYNRVKAIADKEERSVSWVINYLLKKSE